MPPSVMLSWDLSSWKCLRTFPQEKHRIGIIILTTTSEVEKGGLCCSMQVEGPAMPFE